MSGLAGRVCRPRRRRFRRGADEGRHFVAERLPQVSFNLLFELSRTLDRGFEDDVPARDECLNSSEPKGLEELAEMIHLNDVAADIDGAQESDVPPHRVCLFHSFFAAITLWARRSRSLMKSTSRSYAFKQMAINASRRPGTAIIFPINPYICCSFSMNRRRRSRPLMLPRLNLIAHRLL